MFNDNLIAQKFSMSKTKCGYYINFGLAPYYNILVGDIMSCPLTLLSQAQMLTPVAKNSHMSEFRFVGKYTQEFEQYKMSSLIKRKYSVFHSN